jgi:putative ABC transport system permease protein
MLSQTWILFIRNLLKDRLFSIINFSNLVVGFATFILISQFLEEEMHWDKHNVNYDRIYRLQLFMDQPENVIRHTWSVTAALSRHDLVDLPEIEKIVLIHDVGDNNKDGVFLSPNEQTQFLTRYGYYADQTVFDVFTFQFTEGNPANALTSPNSIVLSEEVKNRLFGKEPALGKQVYAENKVIFTVTGVYRDLPDNSEWRPRFLLSMLSYAATTGRNDYEENYWSYTFYTYVLLKKGASPASVDAKIHDALKDYRKEHYPYLRPLSKLHSNPFFDSALITAYSLLSFIALLILVLSSVNFINLQNANASTRMREIGIKKAIGFTRGQLRTQFLAETLMMTAFAGCCGLLLSHIAVPYANQVLGKNLLVSVFHKPGLMGIIAGITLLTGLLSGIYPAWVISAFNPVVALKQKQGSEVRNGLSLKKVLVTIQFGISVFLLIVSFMVYRQSMYMATRDMGFESHHMLFANIVTGKTGSFESIRQKLVQNPVISNAAFSDYIPFILPGGNELTWEDARPDEKVFVRFYNVSWDFVSTYNLNISAGRDFSREYPADREKCLINETAVRIFRWEQPIGKHVQLGDRNVEVIGVIKDYIAFSVHNEIEPQLYRLLPDTGKMEGIYSVRFMPGREQEAREWITREFETAFPNDAFEFRNIQFRIQNENALKSWQMLQKMFLFFAVISVIISSIGLFGLVLFYVRRKMKEIGIRKVLGFSSGNLFYRLSSEFIRLLIISLAVSWPAAYGVYKYLPGAHKYPLQLVEFMLATCIMLVVAMLTISFQILKASRTRPAEVLKDE